MKPVPTFPPAVILTTDGRTFSTIAERLRGVGVGTGVGVDVGTGVAVGVGSGVGIGVGTGVGISVAVGVDVGTGVGVKVDAGLGSGAGVHVGAGVQVGSGVQVGGGVGVHVGAGVGLLAGTSAAEQPDRTSSSMRNKKLRNIWIPFSRDGIWQPATINPPYSMTKWSNRMDLSMSAYSLRTCSQMPEPKR